MLCVSQDACTVPVGTSQLSDDYSIPRMFVCYIGPLSSQEELSADTERGSASSSFSGEKAKRRTVSGDSESGEGRRRREEEEREWWEVFSPGTSEQVLQDIASQVMAVYDCEAGEGGEGGRGSGDRTRDSKEASGTASPKAKSDSSEKIPETMS